MAWIFFDALSYRKINLMTARVSILLKSRASLTCFRACFLPGQTKDLSAPGINIGLPPKLPNLLSVRYELTEIYIKINNICKTLHKFPYITCVLYTWNWPHVVQPFRSCTQPVRNSAPFTKSLATLLRFCIICLFMICLTTLYVVQNIQRWIADD
jgi:hypothetical protein